MALYVGLDVSLRTISICIVEAKGKVVWEGKVICEGPALVGQHFWARRYFVNTVGRDEEAIRTDIRNQGLT